MLIGRVRFILPLDQLKHLACIASPASALVVGPVLSRWIRLPSLRLPSFPGLPRPFHAFSSRFSSLSLCVYCFPPVLSFFFLSSQKAESLYPLLLLLLHASEASIIHAIRFSILRCDLPSLVKTLGHFLLLKEGGLCPATSQDRGV
jgi:hypothetical protein